MTTQQAVNRLEQVTSRFERLRQAFSEDGISAAEQRRLDVISARIERLRRAVDARVSATGGVDIDRSVERARRQQTRFDRARAKAERRRIALSLIELYDELDALIRRAPIDDDGLPVLTGDVQWEPSSPLAGTLADIQPFSMLDVWQAAAAAPPPARVRDRRLQKRMRISSDFARLRQDVVAWLQEARLSADRAEELVGPSNLEEVYRGLGIEEGQEIQVMVTALLKADDAERSYASVTFSAQAPRPRLDDALPDDTGGGDLGRAEGDGVHVEAEDSDVEDALLTGLDFVGEGTEIVGEIVGVALIEALSLGAAVFGLLAGYYQDLQEIDARRKASIESLANEIAVRATLGLAGAHSDGFHHQQVTYGDLNRSADRSSSMRNRIAWATSGSEDWPDLFDRLAHDALARMASLLTQQLRGAEAHYRSWLEDKATAIGASNEQVEAVYRRDVARVRALFLAEVARGAMSRL